MKNIMVIGVFNFICAPILRNQTGDNLCLIFNENKLSLPTRNDRHKSCSVTQKINSEQTFETQNDTDYLNQVITLEKVEDIEKKKFGKNIFQNRLIIDTQKLSEINDNEIFKSMYLDKRLYTFSINSKELTNFRREIIQMLFAKFGKKGNELLKNYRKCLVNQLRELSRPKSDFRRKIETESRK